MSKGRDDAESVSEAKAQSEGSTSNSGGGFSCLLLPSWFFLFVAAVISVAITGTWGG